MEESPYLAFYTTKSASLELDGVTFSKAFSINKILITSPEDYLKAETREDFVKWITRGKYHLT